MPHDDGWDRWCDEKWEEHQDRLDEAKAEEAERDHETGWCNPEECPFCWEEAA